jgi:hypothetical protein
MQLNTLMITALVVHQYLYISLNEQHEDGCSDRYAALITRCFKLIPLPPSINQFAINSDKGYVIRQTPPLAPSFK